jgi:hypothetical protein
MNATVAEDEVVVGRDTRPRAILVSAQTGIDVALCQRFTVDEDDALAHRHHFAGKSDQALDERGASITGFASVGCARSSENHDLPALGVAEPVRKAVGNHSVAESALTVSDGSGAVERWFHRRRRNDIGLSHLSLERENERNRDRNGDEPVDDRPPRLRYAALSSIENLHRCTDILRSSAAACGTEDVRTFCAAVDWDANGSQGGPTLALLRGSSLLSNPPPPLPIEVRPAERADDDFDRFVLEVEPWLVATAKTRRPMCQCKT